MRPNTRIITIATTLFVNGNESIHFPEVAFRQTVKERPFVVAAFGVRKTIGRLVHQVRKVGLEQPRIEWWEHQQMFAGVCFLGHLPVQRASTLCWK